MDTSTVLDAIDLGSDSPGVVGRLAAWADPTRSASLTVLAAQSRCASAINEAAAVAITGASR